MTTCILFFPFSIQAEQQKLRRFRRFLRVSGVSGRGDLLSRVGEVRQRQERERREAVDEDGYRKRSMAGGSSGSEAGGMKR